MPSFGAGFDVVVLLVVDDDDDDDDCVVVAAVNRKSNYKPHRFALY